MKIWVGRPNSFWIVTSIRCVRRQPRGRWGDRYTSWKPHLSERRELWKSLQWCTNRWTSPFDWSAWLKWYFLHHIEHRFVVEVIEEPDAGLTGIFLEGNGITVDDLHIFVIDVPWMRPKVPKRAPTTRLFLCLTLTLLKWSTIDSSTSGCTEAWVMWDLLILKNIWIVIRPIPKQLSNSTSLDVSVFIWYW